MKNLWNKEFEAIKDSSTPDEIIKAQCTILAKMTNDKIVARVSSYSGAFRPYTTKSLFEPISSMMEAKLVDIQKDLGSVSEGGFTFEFFITSTATPNYKYRVLFLRYEIPFYPCFMILDEAIGTELGIGQSFKCDTQEDFENKLGQILGSKKIENVVGALLAIVKKEEDENALYQQ